MERRTNIVGIFPNDANIVRLVGAVLLEQHEEWHLDNRRSFSEASMRKLELEGDQEPAAALVSSTPPVEPAVT